MRSPLHSPLHVPMGVGGVPSLRPIGGVKVQHRSWGAANQDDGNGGLTIAADLSGNGLASPSSPINHRMAIGSSSYFSKTAFVGTGAQYLLTQAWTAISQPFWVFMVTRMTSQTNAFAFDAQSTTPRATLFGATATTVEVFGPAGGSFSTTFSMLDRIAWIVQINGASSWLRANGTQIASGSIGATNTSVGHTIFAREDLTGSPSGEWLDFAVGAGALSASNIAYIEKTYGRRSYPEIAWAP